MAGHGSSRLSLGVAEAQDQTARPRPHGQASAAEAVKQAAAAAEPAGLLVDKGDIAWMLVSTPLVLMMTVPGLALFYGGMVRSKNVLSV